MALANGSLKRPTTNSYTIRKLRTVGCRWIKKDGVWWKYWIHDYGWFYAEVPAYFQTFTVHYTGRPFDEQ